MFVRLRSFWHALRHRSQFESDLDDEMRFHVEARADDLVRSGLSREEASRRARIEFGCAEAYQDRVRESRRINWFEDFGQDVRFAVRLLRKTPALTAVALLSLALGIGANTAIFGLIDAIVLRMLPVRDPQQLVVVEMRSPGDRGDPEYYYPNPVWEQLRDHQNVFAGVLAWNGQTFDLGDGGKVQSVLGAYASGDYFNVLGLRPAAGRLFTAADDHRGCQGVAVLSYEFWQDHYGGAASAIGSTLQIQGHGFGVIGVTERGFSGLEVGRQANVIVPICAEAILAGKDSILDARAGWWWQIVGRLKPGSSAQQTTAGLNVLAPQIFAAAVPTYSKPEQQQGFLRRTFAISPGGTGVSSLRDRYERPLEMLMFIVALVLLIACANVASLMMARASSRQREIAVRLSVGASRARLIRQMLTESLVLSVAGALLGLVFAGWGAALLVKFVSTGRYKVFVDLSMDRRVLGFTMATAILTGLLFGVLPAFRATRVSLTSAVKGGGAPGETARSRFHSGRWVVSVQLALSLILLVGTGLFLRSFWNLMTADAGFDRSSVFIVSADIHNAHIPPEARVAAYQQMLYRLKALPGVVSASQSFRTPIQQLSWNQNILVDGYKPQSGEEPVAYFNWVTPEYFATLRTPLLRGRNFDGRDSATAPHVAIVNEALVRRFFPNADPVGQYFRVDEYDADIVSQAPIQIVGVVKNAKYRSLREDTPPSAYVPLAQLATVPEWSSFELRTNVDSAAMTIAAREAIGGASKPASLEFDTLQKLLNRSLTQDRLLATLSGFFGALALLLTAIGLYGVMAYIVTQRTHEIGIRMALGAQPRKILRLVIWDVATLLAAGTVVGVLGSLWVSRLAQQFLFGLKPNDAGAVTFAAAILVATGLVASYIPARRAMRVDPMVALRHE